MSTEPESWVLETHPGSLVLVCGPSGEIDDTPLFGRWYGLLVGNFRFRFPVEETGHFRALTALGSRPIEHPDVLSGHRYSKGSWWMTRDLARYPDPPFLLTDDPAYRLVYHGPVLLDPTDETAEWIRDAWDGEEPCNPPIAANDWFGMIEFTKPNTDRGQLWAFANRDLRLSGRFDHLASEGDSSPREFGAVIIPSDEPDSGGAER